MTSYSTVVVPDVTTEGEPCYLAYHPELEGCMSHGYTPDEASDNLREARELYLATIAEMGVEAPVPIGLSLRWTVIGAPTQETNLVDLETSSPIRQPEFECIT